MKTVIANNMEVEFHPSRIRWGAGVFQTKSVEYSDIERVRYSPNVATIFTKAGEQHHFSFSTQEELETFRWDLAQVAIASCNT